MKARLLILIFCLHGILTPCTKAQQWPSLTISDGLSGMSVFRVQQDHHLQTWIATSKGVTLFGGGRMIYSFPLEDEHRMPLACNDLVVTADDRIIVATVKGVYRLDTEAERFERIMADLPCCETLLAVGDTLYAGGAGGLAVSTDGGRRMRMLLKPAMSSMDNSVRCLRRSPDGGVWFTTAHALNRLNAADGQIETILTNDNMAFGHFDFAAGRVFLGTKNNGLHVVDTATGRCEPIPAINKLVSDVQTGLNETVYVATDGDGAFTIDAATSSVSERLNTNEPAPRQLRSNAVYCFCQDATGTLWAGFYHNGMSYLSRSERLFQPFTYGSFNTNGHNVTALLKDGDLMLIGTNKGVYRLNTRTGQIDSYTAEQTGRSIVKGFIRYGAYHYVYYYDGGVLRLNTATGQLAGPPIDHPSFHTGMFSAAAVSADGELWLSNEEGVWVLDSLGNYTHYTELNSRIYGNSATSIQFNTEGNAGLTFPDGMVLYIRNTHSFSTNVFPKDFFNNVGNLSIRPLTGDRYAMFSQNQLFVTDEAMENYQYMTLPNNIMKEVCIDVADDGRGHYWIATESGLFKTDYQNTVLQQIPIGYGLTGNQVHSLYTDGQQMWLLTQQGLMACSLDHLENDEQTAPNQMAILLHNVVVGDRQLSTDQTLKLNRNRQLQLPWNLQSTVLRLNIIDSNPLDMATRYYEYSIDNGTMTLVSADDELTIDGLSPGEHTLNVRLAGLPDTTQTFTLSVSPSMTFYIELLMLLMLTAAIYVWWRYRKTTKNIIAEHVETEQAFIEESKAQWEEETIENQKKYAKVRFDEAEMKHIFKRMDDYMRKERPYLNSEFRLKDIAQALNVSPSVLSQVFTLYAKESYYDYINRYRLEAFKEKIRQGEHRQFTINALSEQCGFKRSSFFSTFRKMEGLTPYEYIKGI